MQRIKIWEANTSRKFLDARGLYWLPEGDIGAQSAALVEGRDDSMIGRMILPRVCWLKECVHVV